MPGGRRLAPRTRALLYAPLFLVVGILLVGSASASSVLTWKSPYSGSLHSTHRIIVGPCASDGFGGLHLALSNGHVTGPASTTSSASCNPNSSALADVSASVGLTLPSFTGRSGNHTIIVHWKLNFKVDLTVGGTNCQPGTYAVVGIGFGMEVDNVSNGSAAGADGHSFLFKLTKTGTANHHIAQNITVSFVMAMDHSVTYEVIPGVSISLGSDAPAPLPPATSSCGATADLKSGSSAGLATLVSVSVV